MGLYAETDQNRIVRVAILNDIDNVKITVKKGYTIFDLKKKEALIDTDEMFEGQVLVDPLGLKVGDTIISSDHIRIASKKDAGVRVMNRKLRGSVDIYKDKNNHLLVVNNVDLQSYIKGVMLHEVSHYWSMEALKAQAVCVRSYAIYQMKANKDKAFDVTSDIYSQVYGGVNSERYRTNVAVDKTQGLIITYRNKIFPSYFHATCAGKTESVSELWKQDLPPLKGVVCPYCRFSPHYYWKKNFRLKNIQDKLNEKGYNLGLIKDISVVERDNSDRIRTLSIKMRNDQSVTISGKDFRDIIGPNVIRSNNYLVVMQGYYMNLLGKGWGHGVGLCQWGAKQMSDEGRRFDEILKFYYPGIEIVSMDTLP